MNKQSFVGNYDAMRDRTLELHRDGMPQAVIATTLGVTIKVVKSTISWDQKGRLNRGNQRPLNAISIENIIKKVQKADRRTGSMPLFQKNVLKTWVLSIEYLLAEEKLREAGVKNPRKRSVEGMKVRAIYNMQISLPQKIQGQQSREMILLTSDHLC